jgi:hypothetical protein
MRVFGKLAMLGVACISLTACEQVQKVAANAAGLPTDENVLFWTQDQRDNAFRQMEVLTTTRTIEAGDSIRQLPAGKPLPKTLKTGKWRSQYRRLYGRPATRRAGNPAGWQDQARRISHGFRQG